MQNIGGMALKNPPVPPFARSLDYLFALDTGCCFFGAYSVQSSPFSPAHHDNGGTDSSADGLFITGLARFPRSCIATLQFLCKNFHMHIWEAGRTRLPRLISEAEMKIFTYEHSNPRDRDETFLTKYLRFRNITVKNLFLSCMYFLFMSIQISLINKVTILHKDTAAANYIIKFTFHYSGFVHELLPFTRLKFPIWTDYKICPCNRASAVTGLIWRGW